MNNVLGNPRIFRGALLAGSRTINTEMKLAAAGAIAELTAESGLVPNSLDPAVHQQVADAVCEAAVESGVAQPGYEPAGL